MECWSVYIHINKINNKKYIGITTKDPKKRWGKNGIHYKKQYFYRAITKYGWDNFKHIVMYSNFTEQQAKDKEILLIKLFKTNNSHYGYNITAGGDGTTGVKISEDTRNKLIESHKGQVPWNKGMKNKYKTNTSKAKIELWKNEEYRQKCINSHLGSTQSDETKLKISQNSARARSVLQFDINGIFIKEWDRIKHATENGYKSSGISLCCSEKTMTYKKFIWIYKDKYSQEYLNNRLNIIQSNRLYYK